MSDMSVYIPQLYLLFFFSLNLTNFGLMQAVVILYLIFKKLPTKDVLAFHHLNRVRFIFSAQNHAKSFLHITEHLFTNMSTNVKNFQTTPITLLFPRYLLYLILMAPLLPCLSLKLKSSITPLQIFLRRMILDLFLPFLLPQTISCHWLKFFAVMFSVPELAKILISLINLMESLLLFSGLCFHACTLSGQTLSIGS